MLPANIKLITGIHGVPRSGTSWLLQIFNSSRETACRYQPLFSYAFKGVISDNSTSADVAKFLTRLYETDDKFVLMRDASIHANYPQISKTKKPKHLIFKHVRYHEYLDIFLRNNSHIKFIFIIRNPFAVLWSWRNARKEFDPLWSFEEQWLDGQLKNADEGGNYFGYNAWFTHNALFHELQHKYPDRVKIISYQRLLDNPFVMIQKLCSFAGLTYSEQMNSFLSDSTTTHIDDSYSVYKIKTDDMAWQGNIPQFVIDYVKDHLKDSVLKKYL